MLRPVKPIIIRPRSSSLNTRPQSLDARPQSLVGSRPQSLDARPQSLDARLQSLSGKKTQPLLVPESNLKSRSQPLASRSPSLRTQKRDTVDNCPLFKLTKRSQESIDADISNMHLPYQYLCPRFGMAPCYRTSQNQLSWQTTVPSSGKIVDACISGDGLYRRDLITNRGLDSQQRPDDGWRHSTERYYCVDDVSEVPIDEDFWQDNDIYPIANNIPVSSEMPFEYPKIISPSHGSHAYANMQSDFAQLYNTSKRLLTTELGDVNEYNGTVYNVDDPIFNDIGLTLGEYVLLMFELRVALKMGDTNIHILVKSHAMISNSSVLIELAKLGQSAFMKQLNVIVNRIMTPIPTLIVECCQDGCMYFTDTDGLNECQICSKPRYDQRYRHIKSPNAVIYYFSVYDRLFRILSGDFARFMDYPDLKRNPGAGIVEDVLDSECYKSIHTMLTTAKPDTTLIALAACCDGALVSKSDVSKSIEPLSYLICNLPQPMRYLVHVGTHLAALSEGYMCAHALLASELFTLWESGFYCKGRHYTVAVVIYNTDGRGWEQVFHAQGGGSLWGSAKFDEPTGTFVSTGRVCYEVSRRMLPANHVLRRPGDGPPLVLRSYENMMGHAVRADAQQIASHGMKGIHAYHRLPYFSKTALPNDLMHIAYNIVILILKLIRRHTSTHKNRCVSKGVLDFEHARGRFNYLSEGGHIPWALSKDEERHIDGRLEAVRTPERSDVPHKLMRHLGCKNTHDLMTFAFCYAQHCMGDLGSKEHMSAVLGVFGFLRKISGDAFNVSQVHMDELVKEYAIVVSTFAELFPISEQTFAFSQLLTVVLELPKTGPPRRFWMFRFEALHKLLKSYLRNVAIPVASIAKNWALAERVRQLIGYRVTNPASVMKFFERVGGCKQLCGTSLVIHKLNQMYVETEANCADIIHTVKQSRMIDIHGRTDAHLLFTSARRTQSADLFQAVYVSCCSNGSILQLAQALFSRQSRVVPRGQRRATSVFEWVARENQLENGPPVIKYHGYFEDLSDDQMNIAKSDWSDLLLGFPETLKIFQCCTICGVSVKASWKYSRGGYRINDLFYSLQDIKRWQKKEAVPTILSWFLDSGEQVFGFPQFFFRLTLTSDCVDQAFVCFALLPMGRTVRHEASDGTTVVKTFTTTEMNTKLFPTKQNQINYFVRLSDVAHCRYALGFDWFVEPVYSERVTLTPIDYESMAIARPSHNLGPSGHSYDIGDGLLGQTSYKLSRFCSDIPVEWDDDCSSHSEVTADDDDDNMQTIFNGLHNARGDASGSTSLNGIPDSIVRFMGY